MILQAPLFGVSASLSELVRYFLAAFRIAAGMQHPRHRLRQEDLRPSGTGFLNKGPTPATSLEDVSLLINCAWRAQRMLIERISKNPTPSTSLEGDSLLLTCAWNAHRMLTESINRRPTPSTSPVEVSLLITCGRHAQQMLEASLPAADAMDPKLAGEDVQASCEGS